MAELKERHGLGRCSLRGRTKVLIRALLAAMAYDIKKLVRARRQQPQPIALALRSGARTAPDPRMPAGPVSPPVSMARTATVSSVGPPGQGLSASSGNHLPKLSSATHPVAVIRP